MKTEQRTGATPPLERYALAVQRKTGAFPTAGDTTDAADVVGEVSQAKLWNLRILWTTALAC